MKQMIRSAGRTRRRAGGLLTLVRFTLAFLLTLVAQAILGPIVAAQEFRIYTRVFEDQTGATDAGNGRQPAVVARTLTLFHAGKVYDYIESVGEVIVFEPAHRRFTILSTTRSMATQVEFEDLLEMLNVAGGELQSYVAQPNAEGGPTPDVAEALKFQLAPAFDASFKPAEKSLELTSPFVRYLARCAAPKSPEALAPYLRYADWTCRLNYVLHPQTLYPASRLKLNDALREHAVIPIEVRLEIAGDMPVRLKAEHQIRWQLDSTDRSLIHQWETSLKDRSTRRVSFREYQKAMLVGLSKRTR